MSSRVRERMIRDGTECKECRAQVFAGKGTCEWQSPPPPPAPDPHLGKYSALGGRFAQDARIMGLLKLIIIRSTDCPDGGEPLPSSLPPNPQLWSGCECESATGGWTLGTCQQPAGSAAGAVPSSLPVFLGVKLGPFSVSLTCSDGRGTCILLKPAPSPASRCPPSPLVMCSPSSLLLVLFAAIRAASSCQVHLCFAEYTDLAHGYNQMQKYSVLRDFHSRETHTRQYCQLLDSYNHCMKGLNKSCRGKLDYHAVLAHVKKWLDDYNCTGTQRGRPMVSLRQQEARRQEELARQTSPPGPDPEQSEDHGHQPSTHPPDGKRSRKCKKSRSASFSLASGSSSHFAAPRDSLLPIVLLSLLLFSVRWR